MKNKLEFESTKYVPDQTVWVLLLVEPSVCFCASPTIIIIIIYYFSKAQRPLYKGVNTKNKQITQLSIKKNTL